LLIKTVLLVNIEILHAANSLLHLLVAFVLWLLFNNSGADR